MKIFTFIVEPYGVERTIEAATEKEARNKLWDSLSDGQRDGVECLDCVDENEVRDFLPAPLDLARLP